MMMTEKEQQRAADIESLAARIYARFVLRSPYFYGGMEPACAQRQAVELAEVFYREADCQRDKQ